MNTAEAGVILGKTPWWVRRQCASGELRASFYGGTWNISQEAVDQYIEAHMNSRKATPIRYRRRKW